MTIGFDTTFLVQHDVREAPLHEWARTYLVASVLEAGNTPGLCPQVLAEYRHVITDPARFEHPLTMPAATCASNGCHCLLTTDRRGFALFDGITVLGPPEAAGTSRSPA